MHAISDENTKQNEEILFHKAHQEVWFWLVHVECSFLLNKTNRITLGHLFIGYYFQRTEMILFNCKQLTHSFLWAVFILTSRMSDLAGDLWRGLHELFSLLSIKKWNSSKRERSYKSICVNQKQQYWNYCDIFCWMIATRWGLHHGWVLHSHLTSYFMTTRKSNIVFKAPHVSKGRTVNTTTDLSSSLQCAHAISASKSVCSVCWKWDFNVMISKLVTQPEVDGYILITDSLRGKTHLQSRIVLPTRINLLNMFTKICHI